MERKRPPESDNLKRRGVGGVKLKPEHLYEGENSGKGGVGGFDCSFQTKRLTHPD